MKVIFLDIDGVIQPEDAQQRFNENLDELKNSFIEKNFQYTDISKYDIGAVLYDWNEHAIENLKLLCKNHNAQIVIISNWRESLNIYKLRLLFAIHNMEKYLYDKTVSISTNLRASEIFWYLQENPHIENFVIIDDVDYMFSEIYPKNFVQPDYYFDQIAYEQANEILSTGTKDNIFETNKLWKILWRSKSRIPQNHFFNGSILLIIETYKGYALYRLQLDERYIYGVYRQITNVKDSYDEIYEFANNLDKIYTQDIEKFYEDINFLI